MHYLFSHYSCQHDELSILLPDLPDSVLCTYFFMPLFMQLPGRVEQLNEITSYLDASIVYESADDLSIKLRNLTDPSE